MAERVSLLHNKDLQAPVVLRVKRKRDDDPVEALGTSIILTLLFSEYLITYVALSFSLSTSLYIDRCCMPAIHLKRGRLERPRAQQNGWYLVFCCILFKFISASEYREEVFQLCGTLPAKSVDDSSVLVCELSQFIYCCMSSINAQELIKHFKDRRDQVKPNPLAKLSLSDQQQQCRAERKVVSCCLSIIDAASCSAILLLVDTVCSQAIQAGLWAA